LIFITVGTQLPFDRLVGTVDQWSSRHPDVEVIVQSGKTKQKFDNCSLIEEISPILWEQYFLRANFIVSHAGMGTILKSLEYSKPLIIMPRQAALNEHRNEHQLATVERFRNFPMIRVANNEQELLDYLDNPPGLVESVQDSGADNLNHLLKEIRSFVETG